MGGGVTLSTAPGTGVYRPRRPAATLLHRVVRENLESYVAARLGDGGGMPCHVEAAFREYLQCGILAHGFARAYCDGCGHDFLVAFSCKGRDLCPSCATRRMVETAAHLVDQVLPRVPYRQWVLSVPKRVRWHMQRKPEVTSALLRIFLRAVETRLRQRSPDAPKDARFGAVAFVHRFGSFLNPHIHFHVLVSDGVFSAGPGGEADFHPALDLDPVADVLAVQSQMRQRGLRWLFRHGHLDSTAIHSLDTPEHAGGWSFDASVQLPEWDRQGLERLVRYCARPPLSQERLGRLNDQTLVYRLRKPTVDGQMELILTPLELLDRLSQLVTPPRLHKHRYFGVLAPNAKLRKAVIESAGPAGATLQLLEEGQRKLGLTHTDDEATESRSRLSRLASRCWALLLLRIYECLPLQCPGCGKPMRILAFIQDPIVVKKILRHIGESTQAPEILPARSPPQGEMEFSPDANADPWPEIDQTAGVEGGGWD